MQNFKSSANITKLLEKTVMQVLEKNDVLRGNKVFGMVEEMVSDSVVMVYIDQANETKRVNCNPRGEFIVGDRVIVEYINNNPHDAYIIGIIGNGSGYQPEIPDKEDGDSGEDDIDYSCLPNEPVEIIYNDDWIATKFIYAYDKPETTWTQELTRSGDLVIAVITTYPDGFVVIRDLIRYSNESLHKYE